MSTRSTTISTIDLWEFIEHQSQRSNVRREEVPGATTDLIEYGYRRALDEFVIFLQGLEDAAVNDPLDDR